MSRYTNDMHSSTNGPAPRAVEDRKRGTAHYSLYDHPVDHNGSSASLTRNAGRAVEIPISQPGQYQQRMVPVGPSRPPVANNAPARATANGTNRPPSYPGLPAQESQDSKPDAARYRQQQRRRGYRRADEQDDDWDQGASQAPPPSRSGPMPTAAARSGPSSIPNQSVPVARERTSFPQPRNAPEPEIKAPVSPIKQNESLSVGDSIPRINSPSVMSSVLQPLDKKVQEYDAQMQEAQTQMARLDAEVAALQERRREVETRYKTAKTKHDDYRRQYQGVEKALKGETQVFARLSFDDERPTTQQTTPRPQSQRGNSARTDSWSSLKKPKNESRFRMSKIFG